MVEDRGGVGSTAATVLAWLSSAALTSHAAAVTRRVTELPVTDRQPAAVSSKLPPTDTDMGGT